MPARLAAMPMTPPVLGAGGATGADCVGATGADCVGVIGARVMERLTATTAG